MKDWPCLTVTWPPPLTLKLRTALSRRNIVRTAASLCMMTQPSVSVTETEEYQQVLLTNILRWEDDITD